MDYEAMLEAFYSRLDLKGGKVIDVGAHVGRHTLPLARLVGWRGTCYAFEPIPPIRRVLMRRLRLRRWLRSAVVHPFALSDRTGTADFTLALDGLEESGLRKRVAYNREAGRLSQLTVEVRRLDEVIPARDRIRFIKIDVEGGELDVLRGATRILEESRPVVAFECGAAAFMSYHEQPDPIFELFAARGYSIYSILGARIATVEEFRTAAFTQTFWDYVAFPEPAGDLPRLLVAA
jgi:FkbM family methyltransferase